MADSTHFQQLENSVNLLGETLRRNDKRLYSIESSLVEFSRLMASMEEKMDRVLRLQTLAIPSSPPIGFVTASQTPDSSSSPISTPLSVPITKPYEVINPPQHPISFSHSSPIIPLPHPPLIRVNLPQPSTSLQPRSGMSVISRSLSGFPPRKPPAQNASAVQPMDCVYSKSDCVDRFNNSLKETGRSTGYANAQRTELFVTTSVRLHGRPPPTLVPLSCSLSAMVSLPGNFHSNQLFSATQYHYSSTSLLFQKDAADENSTIVFENWWESVIDFRLRELLVDRNKPLKPPNSDLISLISLKLSAISLLTIVTFLESCRRFLQCDNNAVDAVQFYKNVFETEELKLSSIVLHRNRFGNRSSWFHLISAWPPPMIACYHLNSWFPWIPAWPPPEIVPQQRSGCKNPPNLWPPPMIIRDHLSLWFHLRPAWPPSIKAIEQSLRKGEQCMTFLWTERKK